MHKLILGDCLEQMRNIPDRSIDLILTDPPYGTTACKWDSIVPLEQMWCQVKRVIKPSGAIVMTAQTPFDKVLGSSNLEMLRYEWVWEKTSATGHLNAKRAPMKSHENVLVFYEKRPVYNPQKTSGHKRKVANKVNRADKQSECYGKQEGITNYDSTERYPRSIITFASDKQHSNLHTTQKPVSLMEYLIRTYTNEGETVLDFTMGSGTTGIGAANTGRNFIGIELDEKIYSDALFRHIDNKIKVETSW